MGRCNCKSKKTRPHYLFDRNTMVKSKIWFYHNIQNKKYEDLDFDTKQDMRIIYGDIFPLSNESDAEVIYNELHKHLVNYKI
jgi:hypothetical protein